MRELAYLLLAAFVLTARAEVRAVDDTGVDVVLAAPAQRIVSLAPHATELLFAAGAGARIVGTIKGSNFPPDALSIPIVGDVQTLDLESILVLDPDLVVTWPYTAPAQVGRLRKHGIAVFVTHPASIDGIASDIERLGMLAGTAEVGADAAKKFRGIVGKAIAEAHVDADANTNTRRPRVFYQVWNKPLYTIGGGHLITQAIEACGGENVFRTLMLPAPEVSVEAVLVERPDAIIAGANGGIRPAWLDEWRRWPELPAARDGQLHTVDADRLHRPGPRFAEGVAELCRTIASTRRLLERGIAPPSGDTSGKRQ